MEKIEEIEKKLLTAVGQRIVKYGFDNKAKGQKFYKWAPFGRIVLHLSSIEHEQDFDVTVDVAIRFDELEDIVNECDALLTMKQKSNTYSLGVELGNLAKGSPRRWQVSSAEDIESMAQSITDFFADVGMPYIEKYSNMKEAMSILGRDDAEARLHCPINEARAMRALGLAFLLRQKELFFQIAENKISFLSASNSLGLQTFLEFKKALHHRLTEDG